MDKLSDKIIFKTTWDNIAKETQYHRNNKHIKIQQVLIELHNKECLMIEAEK